MDKDYCVFLFRFECEKLLCRVDNDEMFVSFGKNTWYFD